MLLKVVNEHIQKFEFDKAIKSLRSHLKSGKSTLWSSTNLGFSIKIKRLEDKNKELRKSNKFSSKQVEDIADDLQKLAIEIEDKIEPKSKIWFWGILSKLLWGIVLSLLSITLSTLVFYHFKTPIFENDEKTKIVIYDFDKLTLEDYKIEDIMKGIINLSGDTSWSNHFHAERLEGVTQLDNYYLENNQGRFKKFINKNDVARFLYRSPAAKYGITGKFRETEKYLELDVLIHRKNKVLRKLNTIYLEKDLNNLIYNPCRQAKFLYLLKLFNEEKDDDKDKEGKDRQKELKKGLIAFLANSECKLDTYEKISKQRPYSKEEYDPETGMHKDSIVEKKICERIADAEGNANIYSTKTGTNLWEVFCEMKSYISKDESIQLDLVPSKDTIELTIFFKKNKYYNKNIDDLALGKIGRIAVLQSVDFKGEGHSCIKGNPEFENVELSEKRIFKMLKKLGYNPNTKENKKRWEGFGTKAPMSQDDLEKNRRATVKFFLKKDKIIAEIK